jgi:ribosomal-protein-alanine N-acetyltransferase
VGTALTVIRPMTSDDLAAVTALEQDHQPAPWSESSFRDELSQENRSYLVAGDPIVGFGGIMVIGDEAHVTNLLVSPESRRCGVGRKLIIALVESAIGEGARHLTLEVRSTNRAARSLYASLGLAPVGVRPRYYSDDDALILWAHDIDDPQYLESLR